MRNKVITVVIVGRDNSNTLGLVRQFGPYVDNLHVVLWDRFIRPLSSVVASKFCKSFHWEPTLKGAIDYIEANYKDKNSNVFIVPSGDLPAEAIDQRHDELNPFFFIPGTKEQGLLTRVLDKNRMCKLASELGFIVPGSKEIRGKSTEIDGVNYPCLIKPTKHGIYTKTSFKTRKCKSKDELLTFLAQLDENCFYQVQEYVEKESEVLTYGFRLENGMTKTFGILHRLRGGENTDTTFGYISPDEPAYIDHKLEEKFLEEIGFTGLFSFEYGVNNSKPYFFEVNLRNDATAYWFYLAGVDVPAIWVYESLGLTTENIPHTISEKKFFIDEIMDRWYVKKGLISRDEHQSALLQSSLLKYKCKEDPAPYYIKNLADKLSACYHIVRNTQKRLICLFNRYTHSELPGGGGKNRQFKSLSIFYASEICSLERRAA